MFYYSGHGIYDTNEQKSFLELSDNKKISIQDIWNKIEFLHGKNNYLIIDACNSGGELKFNTKNKQNRKFNYNSKGIYCLFGATEKHLALEPNIRQAFKYGINNSVLTHFFVEVLNQKERYIKGILAFGTIRDYVNIHTQSFTGFDQIPSSQDLTVGSHPFAFLPDNLGNNSDIKENNQFNLPNNHFISNLSKEPLYIHRTVVCHTNINNENILFSQKSKNEIIKLINLISEKSKIVILGSAGLGKSTELKETAITLSELNYYPIFLSLNNYTPDKDIDAYLPKDWTTIPENRIVLFLDGLDEIELKQFNTSKKKISQFTEAHSQIKIVISCRTNFYNLPDDSGVGTLKDFDTYYLQKLSVGDVVKYIDDNYDCEGKAFINIVYENNLSDLVFNPFFLKLLIENYKRNNHQLSSKRAEMFREFINSRFKFDEKHFYTTKELFDEKFNAFKLLRKIAVAMGIVGSGIVNQEQLCELIPEKKDYDLIRYCTVFKKEEGTSDIWKFEHKYFQEFLCAEFLSKQSFDFVKSLICYQNYNKILPTWFNTVAQLISILDVQDDLFIKLINWLIKNDIELLVNVEKEKLTDEIREDIFKRIFEYYKRLKIWIDFIKFNAKDYTYFGKSDKCINYIISQATNKKNQRIVRLNALHVLKEFELENFTERDKAKRSFINMLKESSDPYFISLAIDVLKKSKLNSKPIIDEVFEIVGKRKSQSIRVSMYEYLISSAHLESYVDYFIEGFSLLRNESEDRENYIIPSEKSQLIEGLTKFKSIDSLVKIIEFYSENHEIIKNLEEDNHLLEGIINNAITVFDEDSKIYDCIFELLNERFYHWYYKNSKPIISFFNKTNTKNIALNEIISLLNKNRTHHLMTLSLLIDKENFHLIINSYENGLIDSEILIRLYWDVYRLNPAIADDFKAIIQENTKCVIEIPEQIDWEERNMLRTQNSFDLLFDRLKFKNECLRIFENTNEITLVELLDMLNGSDPEIEDNDIPDSAFELVREFARNSPAKKVNIEKWFENEKNFEWYMIDEACQYIKNYEKVKIEASQVEQLKNWYDKYIKTVDFTKAITKGKGDEFAVNNYAGYLIFLLKKFDFECEENILIDMLSFAIADIHGIEQLLIEDILERVKNKQKFNDRIIDNINNHRIFLFSIYKNHIKYIFENKLEKSYPIIIEDLINTTFSAYRKNEIIDLYIKYLDETDKIKQIFNQLNIESKLYFIEILIKRKDFVFTSEKLLEMHSYETNEDILSKINNYLISSENIKGLEYSIDWIKRNNKFEFSQDGQGLAHFSDSKALPYFLDLLKLSYDKNIKEGNTFDRLWNIVINGIEFLALSSDENYKIVIDNLESFIRKNKGKLENVEFINQPIVWIKKKYYDNKSICYDFIMAKNILHKANL